MRFDVAVLLNFGLLLLSCVHQSKGQYYDDYYDDDYYLKGKTVDRWASAGGGWRYVLSVLNIIVFVLFAFLTRTVYPFNIYLHLSAAR